MPFESEADMILPFSVMVSRNGVAGTSMLALLLTHTGFPCEAMEQKYASQGTLIPSPVGLGWRSPISNPKHAICVAFYNCTMKQQQDSDQP